jgi:hypothetical protein
LTHHTYGDVDDVIVETVWCRGLCDSDVQFFSTVIFWYQVAAGANNVFATVGIF